jgi:hypothetical protein
LIIPKKRERKIHVLCKNKEEFIFHFCLFRLKVCF